MFKNRKCVKIYKTCTIKTLAMLFLLNLKVSSQVNFVDQLIIDQVENWSEEKSSSSSLTRVMTDRQVLPNQKLQSQHLAVLCN